MRKERLQKGKRAMAWLLAVSMLLGNESVSLAVSAQEQVVESVQSQIVEVADESIETVVLNNSGDVMVSASDSSGDVIISESDPDSDSELILNPDGTGTVGIEDIELLEGDEAESESGTESESGSESESEPQSESEVKNKSEAENESESKSESDAGNEPESESEIDMITVEAQEELDDGEIISVTEEEQAEELYAMAGNGPLQQVINEFDPASSSALVLTLAQDYTGENAETIIIPAGISVVLDLNGHTLAPNVSIRTDESAVMNTISVHGKLTICDNSKSKNGRIANADAAKNVRGIAVMKGGTVTFSSGTITGFSNSGNGGGVLVNDKGSFTMTGGAVTGNSAEGSGGGIFAYDGKGLSLTGGAVTKNKSKKNGGGIGINLFSEGGIAFNSAALSISYNEAEGNGGGVWIKNKAVPVDIGAGTYAGNKAGAYGGAFCLAGAGSICNIFGTVENNSAAEGGGIYLVSGCKTTVSAGAQIVSNTASFAGGGLQTANRPNTDKVTQSSFAMTGGRIGENKIVNEEIYTATYGSGLFIGSYTTVEFSGDAKIDQNTGAARGGGACIGYACNVTLKENCVFTSNSTGGNIADTSGGGIWTDGGGTLTMDGGTVSNNNAFNYQSKGGGIYTGAIFTINGGEVSGNTAVIDGGGVYCAGAEIKAGTICNNTVQSGGGGGIWCTGTVTMTGGTVSGNMTNNSSSSSGGAGIYAVTLDMSGGELRENTSKSYGGGCSGGTLKLSENARIISNTALNGGGARMTTIAMTGGEVYQNKASTGAGLYVAAGEISAGTISENNASHAGGGVVKDGSVNLLSIKGSVSITNNSAEFSSGGVYLGQGTLEISGGIITGNKANYGGGVVAGGNGSKLTVSGGQIYDNTAVTADGGNDLKIWARPQWNQSAPSAYISKASDLNADGIPGICWLRELEEVEITEDFSHEDKESWDSYSYTFIYKEEELKTEPAVMAAVVCDADGSAEDGTEYETVQAAINALAGDPDKKVIRMLKDNNESVVIPAVSSTGTSCTNIVLDLAGYALSGEGKGGSTVLVEENATLTIQDSSDAKTGKICGGTGSRRSDSDTRTYGGGLYVKGTAVLESGIITSNTANRGDGVYVGGTGANFTMSGGEIKGNTVDGVLVGMEEEGGTFVMTGGKISNQPNSGVVLLNGNAKFEMKGGYITDNVSSWSRGVFLSSGEMTMTGGEISGNKPQSRVYGGGIYIQDNAVLTMKGGTIKENSATNGGGIYLASGTLNVEGGTITGNTASENGGGIYLASGTLNVEGGTIAGNTVVKSGGGIYLGSGTLSLKGGMITGNTASVSGGGIYCASGSMIMEDGSVTDNAASENGGGIYNEAGTLSLKVGAVYANHAGEELQDIYSPKDVPLKVFKASDMGLTEYNCWINLASDTEKVSIDDAIDTEAAECTYQLAAAYREKDGDAVARIGTKTYKNIQDAVDDAAESGETIYLIADCTDAAVIPAADKAVTLDLNGYTLSSRKDNLFCVYGDLTIQDAQDQSDYNPAGTGGAMIPAEGLEKSRAVYVGRGGSFTLKSGTIQGFSGMTYGGAVLADRDGTVTIDGGTLQDNTATYGGAIGISATGSADPMTLTLTVNGGTFRNNTATYGGAVHIAASTTAVEVSCTVNGGLFENNTADKAGGAVYLDAASAKAATHISVTGGIFKNNEAGSYGAIGGTTESSRDIEHTFLICGGTFTSNKAVSGNNGAIGYAGAATSGSSHGMVQVELSGIEVSGNKASGSSGGISISNVKTVLIKDIVVEDNEASTIGGLFCELNSALEREIKVESAEIRQNTALTGNVGGAQLKGSNILIENITVVENESKSYNSIYSGIGGLCLDSLGGTAKLQQGTITGNRARNGGGLYVTGTSFTMGADVLVSGNEARGEGGGIWINGGGTYTLAGTVTGNKAGGSGGGIAKHYTAGGSVVLNDILIEENEAGNGGGVYIDRGTLTVNTDAKVQKNKTAGSGGGIYVSDGAMATLAGGLISDNTASSGGGIRLINGTLEIEGGTISGNKAYTNGGGIDTGVAWYDAYGCRSKIRISGGEIINNTANYGGGFYNNVDCDDTEMTGGVIRNNRAYTHGGGVYTQSRRSSFKLAGGQIYDNTAAEANDVLIAYDESNYNNGLTSAAKLIKASDMFTAADKKEGIGWYDEKNDCVYTDEIKYDPVKKARYLTLKYEAAEIVAKVGETGYKTVQAAVGAIESGVHDDPESGKVPEILLVADTRENVTIPAGVNAVLNLNGHKLEGITTPVTAYGSLIIRDDKTEDSPGEGIGTIQGSVFKRGGGIHVCSGGYVKLESGQISGCNASISGAADVNCGGGGVYVDYGTFEMAGGSINDCYGPHGSAVYVGGGSSTFIMTDGLIENNTSNRSGAVFVYGGLFKMTGGKITGTKGAWYGGGLYMKENGKAFLYGGEISGNSAYQYGGGIYIEKGTVRLRGTKITGNTVTDAMTTYNQVGSGGGIYINSGTLYLYDGSTVTENTARRGGGIYLYHGSVHMLGGAITGNTADRGGGVAQYALNASYYIMSGGMICGNTSSELLTGNDVYSAYEGTDNYAEKSKDGKPRFSLIPAYRMEHKDYNVWCDDTYEDKTLEAEVIEQGKYITGVIVESNNLQLTASWYGEPEDEKYTTKMEVQSLNLGNTDGEKGVLDGTAEFDSSAKDKEKTAKAMGAAESPDKTYMLNDETKKMLIYDDDPYEQEQVVEWSAGDDSGEENRIVRSYDSISYTLTSTIGRTKESTPDFADEIFNEPEMIRLWMKVSVPCDAEDIVFSVPNEIKYYYMDEEISEEENGAGESSQILCGYWEIPNAGEGATVTNTVTIYVKGMTNGETIKPVFEQWIEGNPNNEETPVVCAAPVVTVSAAPRYNVTLQRNTELAYTSYFDLTTGKEASAEMVERYKAAVAAVAAAAEGAEKAAAEKEVEELNVVHGTMLGFGMTLSLYNDRSPERKSQSMKGMEIPTGPINFDLTLGGSLYMNGSPVLDSDGNPVTATPVIWAYKENSDTPYGSNSTNTSHSFEMDWNDEDDYYRTTRYACNAAPLNSGGCYNGGAWYAASTAEDVDETLNRVTMHFTIDGYSFDDCSGSNPVKNFSAGYVQVIYPLDMEAVNAHQDREGISAGFVEINMEGMASSLDATSATGQKPIGTETNGIDAMQEFFGSEYEKYATQEMNYSDNHVKETSGLYNFRGGPGEGDGLSKTNYFNNGSDNALSGSGGTGSTALGTQVYIGADVGFISREFDTTKEGPHYNPDFDAQVDNRLEYNYMTAMNLLQKFDADAYTPVGTSAIVNKTYDLDKTTNDIGSFIITTNESVTTWSTKKTTSYTLTILYAAKADGSNWTKVETKADGNEWDGTPGTSMYNDGGTADMDKYNEENLIYFATLQDLYDYFGYNEDGTSKGHCVGILYQFRDCCIRTGRSISVHSKMNVTDEFEKTGGTYATTNDARCWSTYRPTYKKYYFSKTLDHKAIIQNFNWTSVTYDGTDGVYGLGAKPDTSISAESKTAAYKDKVPDYSTVLEAENSKADSTFTQNYYNGYKKTQYEKGSKVNGTHTGWYSGNTLLLYTMHSSIFIDNTDKVRGGNGIRTEYNISQGDRTANFSVIPKIETASAVKDNELVMNGTQSTEVEITLTIPKHLYYTEGSIEFNYGISTCKYEDGALAWTIEKTENTADGTTTLVLKTYVSDIDKGLPEICYGCTIGTPDNPTTDIQEEVLTLTTPVKINTTYQEISRISCAANTDQTSIRVVRGNIDYISKTAESNLVELGDDLVYRLNYINDTQYETSIEMLDILPYNGDGRATTFNGGYKITGIELLFFDEESYNNFIDQNDGGCLKIKDGCTVPSHSDHDGQADMLEAAAGWSELEAYEKSFETDTESPGTVSGSVLGKGSVKYDLSEKDYVQYASEKDGIAVYCNLPEITGESAVKVRLTLSPLEGSTNKLIADKENGSQQVGGNIYWNNFIYRNGTAETVVSGEVFIKVADRTISGLAWMDQNQDGIYSIGSGTHLSSDRLLRGINAALYTNSSDPLAAAVEKGYITANEDGTWSPKKADGSTDTSKVYSTIVIDGATYYPAVDVLGSLVSSQTTNDKGSYSFTNLAAGSYFIVFSDENGIYGVATTVNPVWYNYSNGIMPFTKLSVTPDRDTAVYSRPSEATNKAVPNYNGVSDSSTDGPAPLQNAVITNGGDGIVLPTIDKVQVGHYVTNHWNCGLYYIDLSLEKQWLNTRSIAQKTSVELAVTGTIGGTGSDSSEDGTASGSTGSDSGAGSGSDTPAVTYNAVIYTLTQQAAWNSVAVSKTGVSVPVNAPTVIAAGRNGMTITWKIANQYLQAEGAGPDGDGEKIVYSFTETAKDAEGNELKGYITELSAAEGENSKKTFTAKNTQVLFDLYIAKTSSSDSGSTEAGSSDAGSDSTKTVLKDAQYTLYTNEACTEQVSTSITGPQVSGTDGWFRFSNLEAGTWYMKETKAPSGYMLSKAIFKIQITWTGDPAITPVVEVSQITDAETGAILETPVALKKTEVVTDDNGKQKIVGSGNYTVSSKPEDVTESEETTKYTISFGVEDKVIYALPATGGAGIYWNTLAGVALMLGALWLMDRRKRKAA